MNYNQSGLIRPIHSNYAADNGKETTQVDNEVKPETPITPSVPAKPETETKLEVEAKANFADRAFFFAREYWWAVALAAFLLGRYLKRKGA